MTPRGIANNSRKVGTVMSYFAPSFGIFYIKLDTLILRNHISQVLHIDKYIKGLFY